LITGRPGVGKTTIICAVAASLSRSHRLAGFYTDEIRVEGERRGFRAVTFDGRERVMAHVKFRGAQRVGKYGVDVEAIDALAESALAPAAADVYLVDEIGKMECLSTIFVAAMRRLLDSRSPLIATVGQRGAGLIAEVKRWRDVEVWEVTLATRDAIPARVLGWLATRVGRPAG